MRLQKADIALEVNAGEPDHLGVLGMVYTDLAANNLSLRPCGAGDSNFFELKETSDSTSLTSFNYKKRSDTKINASLEADVKNVLVAAGVTGPVLDQLQADFKALYKQAAGRDHAMKGIYYRLGLKRELVRAIQNPATSNVKARTCAATLKANPDAGLIHSVAVIKLDSASYASNVATDAAAAFGAKVRARSPNVNIGSIEAGISTAVRTSLTTALGTEYRVISWDYLDIDDLRSGAPSVI